jgi:succinate dehydrogenase / fumarate reductase, flavoprotein subunit
MPVEVAPIAHYHMGGVVADATMATELPGLFVAGEAVGGANGANRLSGNAISEALAFGRRAGRSAAALARTIKQTDGTTAARAALDLIGTYGGGHAINTAEMIKSVQAIMEHDVGALRSEEMLVRALTRLVHLTDELGERPQGDGEAFDLNRLEWFDLRNMLLVARTVTEAALARRESRGAHRREDFPTTDPAWAQNQIARLKNERIVLSAAPVDMLKTAAQ